MTPAKLIEDLRARFPTFAVVWEGDLIRVEMPHPLVTKAWLRLNTSSGEVRVASPREAIFTGHVGHDNVAVAHYDHVGEALYRVAYSLGAHHTPLPSSIFNALGGPFDVEVRLVAQALAGQAVARAARIRGDADAALAEAQRTHAKNTAIAATWSERAAAYAALVKP
jgi:hypothetical protein